MHSVRRFLFRASAVAAAASIALGAAASSASAWTIDPGRTTSYAEAYWWTFNSQFPGVGDDCTNYVSQVLYYGGLPFQGTPTGNGAHNIANQWWGNNTSWTFSWTVADSLRQYLQTYRGFYPTYTSSGTSPLPAPSGSRIGAVIFYNWGNDPTHPAPFAQHAAIVTYLNQQDPNSAFKGTLVDAHTGAHSQAIWHLIPYNSLYLSTTVSMYVW